MNRPRTTPAQWWLWLAASVAIHFAILPMLPVVHVHTEPPAMMRLTIVRKDTTPKTTRAAALKQPEPALNSGRSKASRTAKAQPVARTQLYRQPVVPTRTALAVPQSALVAAASAKETVNAPAEPAASSAQPEDGGEPSSSPPDSIPTPPPSPPAGEAVTNASIAIPAASAFDLEGFKRRYMASANAKIQREQFYPEAVRRSGADSVTVRVRARFKIKRDGTIAGLSVSSEDPAFARAAEEAVRRAAPFGEFPDELTLPQLSASITLEYRLR